MTSPRAAVAKTGHPTSLVAVYGQGVTTAITTHEDWDVNVQRRAGRGAPSL